MPLECFKQEGINEPLTLQTCDTDSDYGCYLHFKIHIDNYKDAVFLEGTKLLYKI